MNNQRADFLAGPGWTRAARLKQEARDRSYIVRGTVPVGAAVKLTQDVTQYDADGIAIDYPTGLCGWVLAYSNAGFRGIEARVGIATDKGDHEFTVSAGLLEIVR